jgi:hypothetical protein
MLPVSTDNSLVFDTVGIAESSNTANCPSLDFGPLNLTLNSTGITFTAVFRFTGAPSFYEHVFFGQKLGGELYSLRIYRYATAPKLVVLIGLLNNVFVPFYPITSFAQEQTHRIAFVIDPKVGVFGRISLWVNGTELESLMLKTKLLDGVLGVAQISRTNSATNICLRARIFSLMLFNEVLQPAIIVQKTMQESLTAGYAPASISLGNVIIRVNQSNSLVPFTTNNQLPVMERNSMLFNGTGQHAAMTCRSLEFGKSNLIESLLNKVHRFSKPLVQHPRFFGNFDH